MWELHSIFFYYIQQSKLSRFFVEHQLLLRTWNKDAGRSNFQRPKTSKIGTRNPATVSVTIIIIIITTTSQFWQHTFIKVQMLILNAMRYLIFIPRHFKLIN